jgi:membrane-associated protein
MSFLDPRTLLTSFGYIGLIVIIFAESGLFFGFFLPGDSLLLTAGLFASEGQLFNLWILLPLVFVAAVLGDNVGYWFGRKAGPPLFTRPASLLFKPKNLLAAKAFYDKHGGKTMILARFMPFIRTFAPIVAGAVEMHYQSFLMYNAVGGLLWGVGVTLAGFALGKVFPPDVLDKYFLLIVLVVIVLSVLPTAWHLWKENRQAIMDRLQGRTGKKSEEPGRPEL